MSKRIQQRLFEAWAATKIGQPRGYESWRMGNKEWVEYTKEGRADEYFEAWEECGEIAEWMAAKGLV